MKVFLPQDPTVHVVWTASSNLWPMKSETASRSKIQFQAGQKLKQKFPYDSILEDITIPNSRCSLDFFIPSRKIAIEVQGEQHSNFNSFFHNTRRDFLDQQSRDEFKENFCILNKIRLIKIYTEKDIETILSNIY